MQEVSEKFAALGDPTRLAILSRLSKGEASVSELAAPFSMSMPAITKHLKVLESAGLISRSREAQWRPCKIEPEGFKEVSDWIEEYREIWEESFDRLDMYLKTIQSKKGKKYANKKTK
ncbi:MAG: metalloregulator ArsR/SmtB family transcription factor [Oligoflexia bacterium]|nr:metalloregulator ArsR/SmtB family transcription factor [Oligoflexia bacterium]